MPKVYDELRRLASVHLSREHPGQTLQPTALVHEAYLRLSGQANAQGYAGRRHFFAAAAEAMRRVLVENARRRGRAERGGGLARLDLDPSTLACPETSDELIALDEALDLLAVDDPVAARLVQLRYFAGLTVAEASEVLELSPRTADRLWAYARAWLHDRLESDGCVA